MKLLFDLAHMWYKSGVILCYNYYLSGYLKEGSINFGCLSYNLFSFHRPIQDYKIHMDMEIVTFLGMKGETRTKVYNNHMV